MTLIAMLLTATAAMFVIAGALRYAARRSKAQADMTMSELVDIMRQMDADRRRLAMEHALARRDKPFTFQDAIGNPPFTSDDGGAQ